MIKLYIGDSVGGMEGDYKHAYIMLNPYGKRGIIIGFNRHRKKGKYVGVTI